MSAAIFMRGARFGRLTQALQSAKTSLEVASQMFDLIPKEERAALEKSYDIVTGIEQRVWSAMHAQTSAPKKTRKR